MGDPDDLTYGDSVLIACRVEPEKRALAGPAKSRHATPPCCKSRLCGRISRHWMTWDHPSEPSHHLRPWGADGTGRRTAADTTDAQASPHGREVGAIVAGSGRRGWKCRPQERRPESHTPPRIDENDAEVFGASRTLRGALQSEFNDPTLDGVAQHPAETEFCARGHVLPCRPARPRKGTRRDSAIRCCKPGWP